VNRRLGVLISGRGSNLQALIDAIRNAELGAEIALVVSNQPDAAGLDRAKAAGIETLCINHRDYSPREKHDEALVRALRERNVGLVCLAGYMRLVGKPLLEAFPNAILNIHPSLLPSFPGTDAQRQALEYGVKVSGVTVHFVTDELDGGPIVLQRTVPVMRGDTPESLAARILIEEHQAYPAAVRIVLAGGWKVDGRRFVVG
jgi:phosphoribosylglycinamide formyltransferase-1